MPTKKGEPIKRAYRKLVEERHAGRLWNNNHTQAKKIFFTFTLRKVKEKLTGRIE